jgi:hypothetical protein
MLKFNQRSWALHLLCLSLITIFIAAALIRGEISSRHDPDRYYHYAISKVTAETFAPETFPQVKGIGWDKIFYEKEFLFHTFTGLGYRLGQETGVKVVALAFGALLFLSLYAFNLEVFPPLLALFSIIAIVFSQDRYLYRMYMVRPHILAMLLLVGLLYALFKNKKALTFSIALVFALAYHALYLPVLYAALHVVGASIVSKTIKTDRVHKSLEHLALTVAGIMVGAIVNPYFPSNIVAGFTHFKIALSQTKVPQSHFGGELHSLLASNILKTLPSFLILATLIPMMLAWLVHQFHARSRMQSEPVDQSTGSADQNFFRVHEISTLSLLVLVTVIISFMNPRGIELLVPVTVLLFPRMCQQLKLNSNLIVLVLFVFLGIQMAGNSSIITNRGSFAAFMKPEDDATMAKLALQSIPESETGSLVANCNWDQSPYILHARPDLTVLDLLDPTFLHNYNSDLYDVRSSWLNDQAPDSFGVIHDVLKAKFVFCNRDSVSSRLSIDPNFTKLYPKTFEDQFKSNFSVFQVKDRPELAFLDQYDLVNSYTKTNLLTKETQQVKMFPGHHDETVSWPTEEFKKRNISTRFLDLFKQLNLTDRMKEKQDEANNNSQFSNFETTDFKLDRDSYCSRVLVKAEDIKSHVNATFLSIGGGETIKAWRNDQLLFEEIAGNTDRSLVRDVIKLSPPLGDKDRLTFEVCSFYGSNFYGLIAGLWQKDDLERVCNEINNRLWIAPPTNIDIANAAVPWCQNMHRAK